MAKHQRASEDQFNELHKQITEHYLRSIKSGEASIHELKAAAEWCIKNDVNSPAMAGSSLDKLKTLLPTIDIENVRQRVYS
jgi:hypothetical protein